MRDQWVTITGKCADKVIEPPGDWLKSGFDAVAAALKARAENTDC